MASLSSDTLVTRRESEVLSGLGEGGHSDDKDNGRLVRDGEPDSGVAWVYSAISTSVTSRRCARLAHLDLLADVLIASPLRLLMGLMI